MHRDRQNHCYKRPPFWLTVVVLAAVLGGMPPVLCAAEVRALLVPRIETVLSADVAGRVEKLTVRLGDRFGRGQVLVVFDSRVHRARLRIAQAELEEARQTYESNRQLEALNSISTLEVAVARARMQRAEAEAALQRLQIEKCTLKAPFDGRVVKRDIQPHAYASPGQPLVTVIAADDLELQLLVPSPWLRWLRPGHRFKVRVDETGRIYDARVTRLGARVDPVSQTLEIRAAVAGRPGELLAGMSGTAVFADTTN